MGLDFNYRKIKPETETAHWAYSGFNRFREMLAKEALGIDLREMDNFKTDDGTTFGEPVKGISWDTIKSPLKYLLNHSDCDGQISAKRCKLVARELRDWIDAREMIVPKDDYDMIQARLLQRNLENAAKNKSPLFFT